ncbi:RabGAP/TBC [Xylariaceae sp. FL0804]|nr:RabGAP/TBC [Xylariaceae sp. FL0804]
MALAGEHAKGGGSVGHREWDRQRDLAMTRVTKAALWSDSSSGAGPAAIPHEQNIRPYPLSPTGTYVRDGSAPASPVSPRWDSLTNTTSIPYDRTAISTPVSPAASTFRSASSASGDDLHHTMNSPTSENRDEFSPLTSHRLNTADAATPVGNFSRPRKASIVQPSRGSPRYKAPNHSQPELTQLDATSHHPTLGPRSRSREPSVSSNISASTFASLPVRPSADVHARDSSRTRGRQPHPPLSRMPMAYGRAESSGPTHTKDGLPRMASLPTDELRCSFRSQLTASTAQGTLGTERSSIMTKSSSKTSVYGQVDDAFSVDDVMGMYERGFGDDSSPEDNGAYAYDSRPGTAMSDTRGGAAVLEAMSDRLPLPKPSATFPIIRDSTDIFSIAVPKAEKGEDVDEEVRDEAQQATLDEDQDVKQGEGNDEFEPRRPTRQPTGMTTTEESDRDRYGFRKSNQYITKEQYDGWNQGYTDYLVRRRKKWNGFLKESGLMTDNPGRFPPRSAKAKRFVRKGIPPEWRGAAWFYYAGGPAIVQKHAGVYDELAAQQAKDVDSEAIERDLHRTFPDNIKFRTTTPLNSPVDAAQKRYSQQTLKDDQGGDGKEDETPIISSLRRVLHAFSVYNPRIGYCQSLNFLAGLLLLFVESEEQAFWLLNIITRVYLPGTHETSLEGANVDLGVLMSALRESMPGVWAKIGGELDGTDAVRPKSRRHRQRGEPTPTRLPPITLCMTAWFMSCFIGTLPIETTLRVWDIFFYEGSKTLFRIALAIFKLGESEIKAVGDPMEIFQVVQTIPRRLIDASGLIEACFKRRNGFGHLSQETIEDKRQERRTRVKAEREKLARGGDDDSPVVAAGPDVRRKGTLFSRRKGAPVAAAAMS